MHAAPNDEKQMPCTICGNDEPVSQGIQCKGTDAHFSCNACFGHRIAILCAAPYTEFQSQDMHVYCIATLMGLECNAVHPRTDLAFSLLDMAVHGNDAPERGLVAFLKAKEEIAIEVVSTPLQALLDQLQDQIARLQLQDGVSTHIVRQLTHKMMNEALLVPTPCCNIPYVYSDCSAVSTSECCRRPCLKFCGLCTEMFVEADEYSEALTHEHLENDCPYGDGDIFPGEEAKCAAQRGMFTSRVVRLLRDDADDNSEVQQAVLLVTKEHLESLGLDVEDIFRQLGLQQTVTVETAARPAVEEQPGRPPHPLTLLAPTIENLRAIVQDIEEHGDYAPNVRLTDLCDVYSTYLAKGHDERKNFIARVRNVGRLKMWSLSGEVADGHIGVILRKHTHK